jgi:hypothetical protein
MTSTPGQRLIDARIKRGYPTAAAAIRAFGFVKSTYEKHENGTRAFDLKDAERYGKAFRKSPAWILTGVGPQEQEMNAEERSVLEKFRELSDEGRAAVHALCDALLASRPLESTQIGAPRRQRRR